MTSLPYPILLFILLRIHTLSIKKVRYLATTSTNLNGILGCPQSRKVQTVKNLCRRCWTSGQVVLTECQSEQTEQTHCTASDTIYLLHTALATFCLTDRDFPLKFIISLDMVPIFYSCNPSLRLASRDSYLTRGDRISLSPFSRHWSMCRTEHLIF